MRLIDRHPYSLKPNPHTMLEAQSQVTTTTTTTTQVQPRSQHVSDQFVLPFLQPSFDPAAYLNNALPPLLSKHPAKPTPSTSTKKQPAASLAEVSAQTQALVSQLNAHTSRTSNALTQLTDEILRSGGRLAYEIEVLRGETLGLSDSLGDGLRDEISAFVPGGLGGSHGDARLHPDRERNDDDDDDNDNGDRSSPPANKTSHDPAYIAQLQLLTKVRARLESVIQVFGEAMQWPLPHSELASSSSTSFLSPSALISVSAPLHNNNTTTTTTDPDARARDEAQGRAFAARLQGEIVELVGGGDVDVDGGGGKSGLGAALARIEALRELAGVWKGTAEERARGRFVDGLVAVAEERAKVAAREGGKRVQGAQAKVQKEAVAAPARRDAVGKAGGGDDGGYGFLENLQRVRDGLYLE